MALGPFTLTRYLTSKKSVDDRALNGHVLETLSVALEDRAEPLRVLEVGAGLGTMIARLVERGLVRRASYTMLDLDAQLLSDASVWLSSWATERGLSCSQAEGGLRIVGGEVDVEVIRVCAEVGAYLEGERGERNADLVIANAFLDVVHVPTVLPGLVRLAAADGLLWLSINFDGETLFEPPHDADLALMAAYHRSMDERVRDGAPAGDSHSGRHMFAHLAQAGAKVLAAGASDWVVYGQDGAYPDDEAYFLDHILHTIDEELQRARDVAPETLAAWLEARREQRRRGALIYMAHQLDFLARAERAAARG